RNYSEEVAAKIDKEIRSIIDTAYAKATEILNEKASKVAEVAAYLLEHEKMEADAFNALFGEGEGTAAVESMYRQMERAIEAEQAETSTSEEESL
ncbi:MAG: cell division protein FtsH, partial [Clostridia bacterium]|nr:cell division protein FtsH [Clostridia bacterium]